MSFHGPFTKIGQLVDGPVPRVGPTQAKAILIEVGTAGDESLDVLEFSREAAAQLAEALNRHLAAGGPR